MPLLLLLMPGEEEELEAELGVESTLVPLTYSTEQSETVLRSEEGGGLGPFVEQHGRKHVLPVSCIGMGGVPLSSRRALSSRRGATGGGSLVVVIFAPWGCWDKG